jgi:hypothetical protein
MSQHYTRNTVSASAYCRICERNTQHQVHDRRIGPCMACMDRAQMEHELYEERAGIIEHMDHKDRTTAERLARNPHTAPQPKEQYSFF